VTGREKVLAFSYCYHGAVDETLVRSGPDGEAILREGNVGPAVPIAETTRVAEFNDLDSVERALAHGDVAIAINEPALTNIGIVLPEPGFMSGLRELCTQYGALPLIDETHSISAG
jgi:glutamate-1-semialdehyde 2,1-aminomutase